MKTFHLLIAFVCLLPAAAFSQQTDTSVYKPISTAELAICMRNLVELNNSPGGATNLSTIDAVKLEQASFRQVVHVTAPYLQGSPQARHICEHFLETFLHPLKKASAAERQELMEMLCKNFLYDEHFRFTDSQLDLLSEKDFNDTAKHYVEGLINKLSTTYYFGSMAHLLSLAQITKSIPELWKMVNTNFEKIQQRDLDVLASLARMHEKKAGDLLVQYYNSRFNSFGNLVTKQGDFWRHFIIAKNLAFSLDSTVLNCLIQEFRTIDINYAFRDGDTGFYPAQYAGGCIVSMIKNYPYEKEASSIDPKQLLAWLNTNHVQLKDR